MSQGLQQLLAALIVVIAVGFTIWKLAPAKFRQRVRTRLGIASPVAQDGCSACGSEQHAARQKPQA